MKLSIVIPVYNETNTITPLLEKVKNVTVFDLEKEIILVDDFSTDGTRQLLQQINDPSLKIIYHDANKGKGAALETGFAQATGEIVIVQDADLEYDPAEIPKVIEPILKNSKSVVYGSRYLAPAAKLKFWHSSFNKLFTNFSNLLTGQNLTDIMTCYKAFDKKVLDQLHLTSQRFGFEPEVTIKISRLGITIYEVPISYFPRNHAEGKHMNLKWQTETLFAMLKYFFTK